MDGQVRLSELIAPVFYDLHRDFQRGGHAEYWLKGGRGSAKSSFASVEVVLSILKNPDVNAVVYRKVAATLRESVYEQIGWAIGRMGLSEWFLQERPEVSRHRRGLHARTADRLHAGPERGAVE